MGIIQFAKQIYVSRAQKKVIDTSNLRMWLQQLRQGSISVDDFVSAYSSRDSRILEIFPSFDNVEGYRQYLLQQIHAGEKYDHSLGDIVNIDSLARHEEAHRNGAAKYGIDSRYIFFDISTGEYGGMTVTTNLDQIAVGWDYKQFEKFWHDFVIAVHENPEFDVEHRRITHYAHPIYAGEFVPQFG